MLRKTMFGLTLVAIMATGAIAQAPFQDNFKFVSGSNPNNYKGEFTTNATVGGVLQSTSVSLGLTGEAVNTPFQIWCIDPLDGVSGSSVPAWVTPFWKTASPAGAQTDLSKAFAATNALDVMATYEKAAWLASNMSNTQGANNYGVNDYQYAMWLVMGYTGSEFGVNNSGLTKANQLVTQAGTNYVNVDLTDWGIINEATTGRWGNQYQEFLYCKVTPVSSCVGGGTTQSVVPEPGTVSLMAMGLVGLTGTSIRRRRRRKA